MNPRLQGREFDSPAAEFLTTVEAFSARHPFARGPAILAPWRMSPVSVVRLPVPALPVCPHV